MTPIERAEACLQLLSPECESAKIIRELLDIVKPLQEIAKIANLLEAPCCDEHDAENRKAMYERMRLFVDDSFSTLKVNP